MPQPAIWEGVCYQELESRERERRKSSCERASGIYHEWNRRRGLVVDLVAEREVLIVLIFIVTGSRGLCSSGGGLDGGSRGSRGRGGNRSRGG